MQKTLCFERMRKHVTPVKRYVFLFVLGTFEIGTCRRQPVVVLCCESVVVTATRQPIMNAKFIIAKSLIAKYVIAQSIIAKPVIAKSIVAKSITT